MKILKQESGQVLVLSALSMMLLMGFMGLAADVGTLFHAKRQLQSAADAAAVAGMFAYKYSGSSTSTTSNIDNAALAAVQKNGFSNVTVTNAFPTSVTSSTLYVSNPPTDGPNRGSDFVEAILTVPQSTFFMAMFGTTSMNVTARAVAGYGASTSGCALQTGQTGTDMYMAGRFTVLAPDCTVANDSSDPCSMQFNGTSGQLITAAVSTVGGACGQSQDSTPAPVTNGPYIQDPLEGIVNPISSTDPSLPSICGLGNTVTSATISSISSANISGNIICFNPPLASNGKVQPTTITGPPVASNGTCASSLILPSAVYIFYSGVVFGGGCVQSGAGGVTFDLGGSYTQGGTNYSFSVSTETNFLLNPMTTSIGNFGNAGVLIMQPDTNTAQINIDQGTSIGTINGTIYAPGAELSLTDLGATSSTGVALVLNATLIDNSLSVQASNITINAQDPGTMPAALRTVTLVE